MEETDITGEELRKIIVEEMNKSKTIEEAINEKNEIRHIEEESFKTCYDTFRAVNDYNNSTLTSLKSAKIDLYMMKLASKLINNDAISVLNDTSIKIDKLIDEVDKNKILLKKIKRYMNLLLQNEVIDCNYNIVILLSNIYLKTKTMVDELSDYIEASSLSMQGINYISNKGYKESKESLDEEINSCILKLGIKK